MYNMVNTNSMSEHKVYLSRKDEEEDFSYKTYDRSHLLKFGVEPWLKLLRLPIIWVGQNW